MMLRDGETYRIRAALLRTGRTARIREVVHGNFSVLSRNKTEEKREIYPRRPRTCSNALIPFAPLTRGTGH